MAYSKKEIVKIPRKICEWSSLQEAIFKDIESGIGNTQIDAFAGCGKTATLVECTFRIPNNQTILCCAFSKDIKEELEARVKPGCNVQTMHSIGFAALKNITGRYPIVNNDKLKNNIAKIIPDNPEYNELRIVLEKAVNFCKYYIANTYNEIQNVIDNNNIEIDSIPEEQFIANIQQLLTMSKSNLKEVDYTDMVWLPIVMNVSFPKYDFVFIDEAQDLNKCQIEIALKSVKKTGRVISLGDENQAIYSWAGADTESIYNIVTRMQSKRLPLSVTYRCPKKVVLKAQAYVSGIQAAPSAKDGEVIELSADKIVETIKPGDVLLSRVNAPLLSFCMKMLKNRIPCNIMGRDIGVGIIALIDKSKAKSIDNLIDYINSWRDKEVEKLIKREKDCTHIHDKADCIIALAEDCGSIMEMKEVVIKLFSDNNPKSTVICSSVHRYKGKESKNVFVLNKTLKPGLGKEEKNITYVAYTRAIEKMYLAS
jgi:DNA helicase-2/ATP-dependent DNA helicase PcrA